MTLWWVIAILIFLIWGLIYRNQVGGSNGALGQLTAKGPQDMYLTGPPVSYLPVSYHADYGFPKYDMDKYPYFFYQSLF